MSARSGRLQAPFPWSSEPRLGEGLVQDIHARHKCARGASRPGTSCRALYVAIHGATAAADPSHDSTSAGENPVQARLLRCISRVTKAVTTGCDAPLSRGVTVSHVSRATSRFFSHGLTAQPASQAGRRQSLSCGAAGIPTDATLRPLPSSLPGRSLSPPITPAEKRTRSSTDLGGFNDECTRDPQRGRCTFNGARPSSQEGSMESSHRAGLGKQIEWDGFGTD
jgi:hypothetical protein